VFAVVEDAVATAVVVVVVATAVVVVVVVYAVATVGFVVVVDAVATAVVVVVLMLLQLPCCCLKCLFYRKYRSGVNPVQTLIIKHKNEFLWEYESTLFLHMGY